YIFHRKNTMDDIKSCISNNEKRDIQYEAFILNERCHYTGGFCSSFHCDELEHLCKLPYEIIKINSESCHFEEVDKKLKSYYEKLDNPIEYEESQCSGIKNKIGDTGCGLCSLKKLKEAGVTHLKVVGRGNSLENMQRDIKGLKKAIAIIDEAKDSEVYEDRIKKEIINGSCSGECYY
ncbi:MAG: U32 family peptidase, partial [Clostridium sp.]